jgi:FkbM family methyltransferase
MNLKTIAKRVVSGTAIERPARAFAKLLPSRDPISAEDQQTLALMQSVVSTATSCIDVGCHKGFFLRYMRDAAPSGRHFAFEPIPSLYQNLVKEYGHAGNITVSPFALSDQNGHATFHYNHDNPPYSGLLKRRYPRKDDRVEIIDVEMRRLDDLIPADVDIAFIKIDVEGAELPVLRGGRNLIARCKPMIVFEFGTGSAENYGTTPENMFGYFEELGYGIWLLEDRLAGAASLTMAKLADEYRTNSHWYFVACAR